MSSTCYCSTLNSYLSQIPNLNANTIVISSVLSQLSEDGFTVLSSSLDSDLVNVLFSHSFLTPSQLVVKCVVIGDVVWVHSLVQDLADKSASKNLSPIQFNPLSIVNISSISSAVRNADKSLTLPTLSKLFGDSVLSIHKNISSIRNKIQSGISSVVIPCFDDYMQSIKQEKAATQGKHVCFSYSSTSSHSSPSSSAQSSFSPSSPSPSSPSSSSPFFNTPSKSSVAMSVVASLPNSSSSFPTAVASSSPSTSSPLQVASSDSTHSSFSSPSSSSTTPTSGSSLFSSSFNPPVGGGVGGLNSLGGLGGFGNSDIYPTLTGVGSGNFMGNRGGGGGGVDPLRIGPGGSGGAFGPDGNLIGPNHPIFHSGFGNQNYHGNNPDDIDIPALGSLPPGARFDPVGPLGDPSGRGLGRMFPGRYNPDGSAFGNNYFV